MKWNTPPLWIAVGFAGGIGTYTVIDKGGMLELRLNETECQRFDRRCAMFNAAGTHWIGSALCTTIYLQRSEEKCAKLNGKLDEVVGPGEFPEKEVLPDPGIHLKNWSGVWETDSYHVALYLSGEMENPASGKESYKDVDCKSTVYLHYDDWPGFISAENSFLCSSIRGLSKGEADRLKKQQVIYLPRESLDYPIEMATMKLKMTLTNPFGEEFERSFPTFEIPVPPSDQRFDLPVH